MGTLYDLCSVHQGMFSTSGVFNILGDTMSTLGGYHEYIGGYHEYIGGHMMNVGGYHEYIRGCSVHWRSP